ncbi:MAG: hypothetical protein IOC76_00145 [Rhodobacter sp.]|nr:hypothetical protein [Rhodobacter sp.]MCA3551069.1 hypothetical protein [Rhodobacter sp.]
MTRTIYLDTGTIFDLEKTGYGILPTQGVLYKIPDLVYYYEIGHQNNNSSFRAFQAWMESNSSIVEIVDTKGEINLLDPAIGKSHKISWNDDGSISQIGDGAFRYIEQKYGVFSKGGARLATDDFGLINHINGGSPNAAFATRVQTH